MNYDYEDHGIQDQEDDILRVERMLREHFSEDMSITGYVGEGSRQFIQDEDIDDRGELIKNQEIEAYTTIVDDDVVNYFRPKDLAITQVNISSDNSINNTYYQSENIVEEIRQIKQEIKSLKNILVTKTKEDKKKEELYNKINKNISFIDEKVEEINSYSSIYTTTSYKENAYVKQELIKFINKNPKLKKQDIINVAIITFIKQLHI